MQEIFNYKMQSLDAKKLISSEKIFPIKQGKPISMSR